MYKIIGYDMFCHDFEPIYTNSFMECIKICRTLESKGYVVFASRGEKFINHFYHAAQKYILMKQKPIKRKI
jgi:hypothetical protein